MECFKTIKKLSDFELKSLEKILIGLNYKKDPYKSTMKRQVIELKSAFDRSNNQLEVIEGYRHLELEKFCNSIMPTWEIGLIMKYEAGGKIGIHRDQSGYGKKARSVSTIDFDFFIGNKNQKIQAGEVIEFDSKVPHGVLKIERERFAIATWEIDWTKATNRKGQLSLF